MALSQEQQTKWQHRIAVMLDIANDEGATSSERVNARNKASAMMLKYNIEESDLSRTDGDATSGVLTITRHFFNKWRKSHFEFKAHRDSIASAVCRLVPVKMMFSGKTRLLFLGTQQNINWAMRLYDAIDLEIEARSKIDAKIASKEGVFADINPSTWYGEYKMEASRVILSRAVDLKYDRETQGIQPENEQISDVISPESVVALVVLHDEAIAEYIEEEWGNKLGTYHGGTKMRTGSGDARRRGNITGNQVKLTQDIES